MLGQMAWHINKLGIHWSSENIANKVSLTIVKDTLFDCLDSDQ
jgi:hypothetical protein